MLIFFAKNAEKCQASHSGVESCLRRARDAVFWPRVTAQVKAIVQQCETFNLHGLAQQKEPLNCHSIPNYPWEAVGTDLFSIGEHKFLIRADYLTGFWEVDKISDTTSPTVIMT